MERRIMVNDSGALISSSTAYAIAHHLEARELPEYIGVQ